MENIITANDLKVRGISIIDEIAASNNEVIITVRGRDKYVVLPVSEYNKYREYELDIAIKESREDIKKGNVIEESVKNHINRIKNV